MSAIDKQVQIALTKSRDESQLSSMAYVLARQLGLYQWLADSNNRFGSVGQEVAMSQDFLHREFWHTYESEVEGIAAVIQVWIVETNVLSDEYPFRGQRIVADAARPNLFVAQQSGMQRRVILEINSDETAVLHAVIRQKARRHYEALDDLTDDVNLKAQVKRIYQNIIQRLKTRNIPYTYGLDYGETPDPDTLYLPLPIVASETYTDKIVWLLERSDLTQVEAADETDTFHEPQWQPEQQGDVARRMRQLDMVKEIGSVRGVYDAEDYSSTTTRWEKMVLLERADHEQRIVGCGTLNFDDDLFHIIVIMRDKTHDAIGQQFLIRYKKRQWIITTNVQNETEDNQRYKEDMLTYLKEHEPQTLTVDELTDACETWEDGLRVAPWLDVVFKIVEAQAGYTTSATVARLLRTWLGLKENEETTSQS